MLRQLFHCFKYIYIYLFICIYINGQADLKWRREEPRIGNTSGRRMTRLGWGHFLYKDILQNQNI